MPEYATICVECGNRLTHEHLAYGHDCDPEEGP